MEVITEYTVDYSKLNNTAVYKKFINICCDFCDAFSLSKNDYAPDDMLFPDDRYLTSVDNPEEYDTKEVNYTLFNRIIIFEIDSYARSFLFEAQKIEAFNSESGFEDLCFYKNNKVCFLGISHEQTAFWENADRDIILKLHKLGIIPEI